MITQQKCGRGDLAVASGSHASQGRGKQALIAEAQTKLDQAASDRALLDKVYANRNAKLSPEELKQLRRMGIDPRSMTFQDVEAARTREFEARQALDALSSRSKNGQERQAKTYTGVMSDREARTPLTAKEQEMLNSTLNLRDGRNYSEARVDLAASRESAARDLASIRREPGYENLSVSDVQALRSYTLNGYVGMNAAMRGMQNNPGSELAQRQRIAARAANQALEKLPAYRGEVRRDTTMSRREIDRDFREGNIVTFRGMTSTSTDLQGRAAGDYGTTTGLNKASLFRQRAERAGVKVADIGDRTRVEFRIRSRSGRDISRVSGRGHEAEVLLPHGWRGRVTRRETRGDRTVIYMEEA